jgi:hypothetical protein
MQKEPSELWQKLDALIENLAILIAQIDSELINKLLQTHITNIVALKERKPNYLNATDYLLIKNCETLLINLASEEMFTYLVEIIANIQNLFRDIYQLNQLLMSPPSSLVLVKKNKELLPRSKEYLQKINEKLEDVQKLEFLLNADPALVMKFADYIFLINRILENNEMTSEEIQELKNVAKEISELKTFDGTNCVSYLEQVIQSTEDSNDSIATFMLAKAELITVINEILLMKEEFIVEWEVIRQLKIIVGSIDKPLPKTTPQLKKLSDEKAKFITNEKMIDFVKKLTAFIQAATHNSFQYLEVPPEPLPIPKFISEREKARNFQYLAQDLSDAIKLVFLTVKTNLRSIESIDKINETIKFLKNYAATFVQMIQKHDVEKMLALKQQGEKTFLPLMLLKSLNKFSVEDSEVKVTWPVLKPIQFSLLLSRFFIVAISYLLKKPNEKEKYWQICLLLNEIIARLEINGYADPELPILRDIRVLVQEIDDEDLYDAMTEFLGVTFGQNQFLSWVSESENVATVPAVSEICELPNDNSFASQKTPQR